MTATAAVANPLPWAGQPNVTCTLTRRADGMILGRCVVNMPAGGEPIVIQATVNEKQVIAALMKRYAPQIQAAKASGGMGHVGLFGFIKKIAKVAKKIARGKVIGKLVGGFKKVMSIPVVGPMLGVAVPALGASYLALKGAEKLGLSPFQAQKLMKIKNPRVRAAIAQKLRGRLAMVNRRRWQNAQRRQGMRPQRGYGGRGNAVQRAVALLRSRGMIAGDAAVAGRAVALSNKLLTLANSGNPIARARIATLNRKAKAGDPNAIRGRRILIVCAKALRSGHPKLGAMRSAVAGSEYDGSPFYDIAGELEMPSLLGEEDGSIAGDWVDINGGSLLAAAGAGGDEYGSPFYDIGAHTTAGELNPNSPMSLHNYYTIMGWGPGGPGADVQTAVAGPYYDIAGNAVPSHTHQVPMPDYHCKPQPGIVTSSSGYQTAGYNVGPSNLQLVIGNDGKQYHKSWNGIRWVWSELRPHRGIRSETQGFGLRDALLLGMQKVQARELQS